MKLRIWLAALAGLGLVAGCGSGKAQSSHAGSAAPASGATTASGAASANADAHLSGSVTMWAYPLVSMDKDQAFWNGIASDFMSKNPGVKVKVVMQPWANRDQLLTTAIAGGSAPDVFYSIAAQIAGYANQGALLPLDSTLQQADSSDINPSALAAAKYKGKTYMLPVLQGAEIVAYNTKAFKKAGITTYPHTWDELKADAPKLKAAGYYLMEYDGNVGTVNHNFLPFLWQAGGDMTSADGTKVTLNSDPATQTLTFLKSLVDGGYIPKDMLTKQDSNPSIPSQHVLSGDVAIEPLVENGAAPAIIKAWGQDGVHFGPPFQGPAKEISYGVVAGFSVLKGTKSPEAAKAWVRYITSAAVAGKVDTFGNLLPARASLSNIYPADSTNAIYLKYLSKVQEDTKSPIARDLNGIVEPAVQAVLIGKESIKQALDGAAQEAESQLQK